MQGDRFNFTRDVLERLARRRPSDEALRAVRPDGSVRSYSFEQAAAESATAAAGLARLGVGPGDVVMTLMGARPEWVFGLLAAWRLGAVALPCSEQLRAKDIALRIAQARPALVLAADRDMTELQEALAAVEKPPRWHDVDADGLPHAEAAGEPAATSAEDPALLIFTSGTAGEPRAVVQSQGYLRGQATQAEHWFGPRAGELAWCTAASGWSKSARNAFVAPWTMGAAALLHDARFEPTERLAVAAEHGVAVLCQSPTEYRMIAKRASLPAEPHPSLRRLVSAGEPLNPEVIGVFREAMGLEIHDGYGQTETGPADRHAGGRAHARRVDGPGAAGLRAGRGRRGGPGRVRGRADARPVHGPDVLSRIPRRAGLRRSGVADRRPRAARRATASCGSRAGWTM